MITDTKRQIMTKTYIGKRQIKEVISAVLVGAITSPQEIWLVSAWVSNFELLDNRGGDWSSLNPSWGCRIISFFEVLETAVLTGCKLNLVVKKDDQNEAIIQAFSTRLKHSPLFRVEVSDDLHTKGLLMESAFLSGSMNFTFYGTNKNDEEMTFFIDSRTISDTKLFYQTAYFANTEQEIDIEISEEDVDDDFF
ncbi:TPA: hypothetical protein NKQ52_004682 [Vibrio parahaemolyticus]|nr:hypothetical protein [Vibrio parahaemolyticus]MDF4873606.1 phospholipase D-like domain-containing protein DpdK [Vibrio parahaemolyticus]HCG9752875.1 hypothetical protein [Vibrio parahaemolyticus]HCH1656970.1 hypothetical protein [Vibrio parahaemolyticus]HCH1660813.1 hypothetical protein [Vibrio parahaemolyticus]